MASDYRNTMVRELTNADITSEHNSWQHTLVNMVQASFGIGATINEALSSILDPILELSQAKAGIILHRDEDGKQLVEVASRGFANSGPIKIDAQAEFGEVLINYLSPELEIEKKELQILRFGTKETESGLIALYIPGLRENDAAVAKMLEILRIHISVGINRLVTFDTANRRDLLAKASLIQLGKAMGSTLDIKKMARQITQAAMGILGADLCDILLLREGALEFQVVSGVNKIFKGFGDVPLRKDPAAAIIAHGRPIVIKSIRSKSRFHERPWLNRESFRSYIGVPIKQDDKIVGVLEAFSKSSDKFSADDLKIFQSLAGPVAASVQNIQFFEQTKEKAEKLRILHTHISRIVAEQDIAKMMKEIVDAARAAAGSLMAAAALYDPETGRFEYRTSNIDPVLGERELPRELPSDQDGRITYTEEAYAEILRTGKPLRLADIKLINQSKPSTPGKASLRGFLGVPLIDQDKNPCGVVMVSFKKDSGLFTAADEEILTTLANQASIAIQNSNLYQKLEYRAKGFNNIFSISQKMNETYNSKKIQKAVIKSVTRLFDVKSACIALYDNEAEEFVISECLVSGSNNVKGRRLIIDKGLLERLFNDKKAIFARADDITTKIQLEGGSIGCYFDSFFGVPLVVQNRVIGLLGIAADWTEDDAKTADKRELLQIFANKVAIAIENSRLYEEALQKAENLSKILDTSRVVTSEIDLNIIFRKIAQAIKDIFKIRHGCIFLSPDPDNNKLELAYKWGLSASESRIRQMLASNDNLPMQAFCSEKVITAGDLSRGSYPCKEHIELGEELRSGVAIPLVVKGKARGVIALFAKEPSYFTHERMSLINIFTNQLAVVIRNNQLYHRAYKEGLARREAEMSVELLQERAKNAIVIDKTSDGIFMVDADRRIQLFNPALEEITGRAASSVIGKRCKDVFREVLSESHVCDRCPLNNGTGKPSERLKSSIRLKNGELKYIEISHSIIEQNGSNSVIGTIRDITKDHELEVYHHDLRIATEVQKNILPSERPQVNGLDIGFMCRPAKQIGGDYFDFIPLGNEKHGIAIGDVAGKSLPAALLVSMHKYILRSAAANTNSVITPLRALNQILWEDTSPEVFVTTIYGIYDTSTSSFTYANAGHLPPLLHSNRTTKYLWTPQTPLGIQENLFIEQQQVKLKAGDVLVLLSDGVTDIRNHKGDCFGFQRLRRMVRRHSSLGAQELADLIYEKTMAFSAGELIDDFTIVVLKCTKQGEETSSREIVVANKPIAVNDVRRFVSAELKKAQVNKGEISDILVAVCEAVTNCVMHGQSPDGENNNIRVGCAIDEENNFLIKITDSGIGYNPNLAEWRPPDLVRDRGRGIFLMQELMDHVEFVPGDRGSSVIMTKRVHLDKDRWELS